MDSKRQEEIIDKLCECSGTCSSDQYFLELKELGNELKKKEEFISIANFGMALSSVERLIILYALREKDRCVCELETIIDKTQSTVSHHLRKLERANLIRRYTKGNYNYYHLEVEILNNYLALLTTQLLTK